MLGVGAISEENQERSGACSAQRFLHLVPTLTLFRTPLWKPNAVVAREIGLSVDMRGVVRSNEAAGCVLRRIYPNGAYLVAGFGDRKQGVIVDVLPEVDHVRLEYVWTFPTRFNLAPVRHVLDVELREGPGNWFSTYAVNWPPETFVHYEGFPAPLYVNPVTHLDHSLASYGDHRHVMLSVEDGVRVVRERVVLFGCAIDDMPCLDSFER